MKVVREKDVKDFLKYNKKIWLHMAKNIVKSGEQIMALLNKLFFPTATTSPLPSVTPSPATVSTSAKEVASVQVVSSAVTSAAMTFDPARSQPSESNGRNVTYRSRQNKNEAVHSRNYLSQFPFDGRQVRILLYRECDRTGRKLLFDSNALQKVPLKEKNVNIAKAEGDRYTHIGEYSTNNRNRNGNTNSSKSQAYKTHSTNIFIEVCEEFGYKHTQPNSTEFTSIGEMVFGASAMSFRGTAFKVHWLQQPPRVLCSQVFLTPVLSGNGHSPYSTISSNSLATPRTSITSEHGSIDSFSLSSFSMLGYSMSTGRQLSLTSSDRVTFMTSPLDVPDQQSLSGVSDGGRIDSAPHFSSTNSNATDSGYDDMSRSQMSSDQWSSSYQYSTRSSLGSMTSEQMDSLQKYNIESAYFTQAFSYDDNICDGSLQRRISRNLRTSFENENAINDLIGFISDNYPVAPTTNCGGSEGGHMGVPNYRRASYCANESRSNPEIGRRRDASSSAGIKTMPRRAKLGLAVCITMSESFEEEMELFCSEHIALLESMLGRLRACTERAYINHKEFYQTFPFIYILMSNKSLNAYIHVLQYIQSNIFDMKPTPFTTDFEYGLRKALSQIYPQTKLKTCWFHFTQAVRRNASKLPKFMSKLNKDNDAKKLFSKFLILPLLKPDDILIGYLNLKNQALSYNLNSIFEQFIAYFERQWIKKMLFRVWVNANSRCFLKNKLGTYEAENRVNLKMKANDKINGKTMFQAWLETQQWFSDLFTAPRIKCPIWLSITTSGNKYSKSVAEKFMKELCWLLSFADTKDTNFFISTMLTAVLTHHLGWVSTVAAFNSTSSLSESSTAALEQRAKLLQVSQKHPYNALWAQMGDLYGAIGLPPRLTRTIIYGTEKLAVERLLNILTYFIRCGEVRRSAKREDFSKDTINSLVHQRNNEILKMSNNGIHQRAFGMAGQKKNTADGGVRNDINNTCGLKRISTCKLNLNTISDSGELSDDVVGNEAKNTDDEEIDGAQVIHTLKKNEIPTVLAFRDSRFVQQELRIGNYLMDTGIEKKSLLQFAKISDSKHKFSSQRDGKIRVLITTPENEEMTVEEENSIGVGSKSVDRAVEAIEIDNGIDGSVTYANKGVINAGRRHFFWQVVKEGLSLSQLRPGKKLSAQVNVSEYDQLKKQMTLEGTMSNLSLSDLITQNSMGKSDRMTWGIEPRRENVSLEEEIHFDNCQKNREHGNCNDIGGVVFTLGENEPLVNLRKSTEDLTTTTEKSTGKDIRIGGSDVSGARQLCALHKCTYGPISKRHSGVKFNFEQFPQIATNYMKSKNLVLSNYDILGNKNAKLESQSDVLALESLTSESLPPVSLSASGSTDTAKSTASNANECMVCNSILISYQTPSNATELEFETDEIRYPHCQQSVNQILKDKVAPVTSSSSLALMSVSSAASIDTLKSSPAGNDIETLPSTAARQITYNTNVRKVSSHRSSISSVAAKCAAANEAIHLLKLPVPAIRDIQQEDEPSSGDGMKLRAGFVPSLFLGVNDHYISDMVLQGTCAPPDKWQMTLREDLLLSARTASLISLPAENVAIVANMEKWEVRLISSQLQHFPYAGEQSTPVGMSQLVSSMLETIHAMNSAGICAYECLSFLESKMQEIYLQSESLAAFLLETDFCQLSSVTTALNLTENDVPLLLSIASIHTPQIAKKCGISFR